MQRKQFLRCLGVALGSASVGPLLSACGGGGTSAPGAAAPDPVADLSAEEVAGLLFMREEEKLAHDVYVALFGLWGAQVFTNIADSETEHTEAVRQLILAHGLEDPAATTLPGVFVDASLQALYDQLVAQGTPSLVEALKVGCLIEEKDIQDIELEKAQVADEPDIVQVYDRLLCGSRNHLRAFSRTLTNQGGSYTPVFLSQAQWDAIAGSEQESCGG